jgi:hypothetical protein
MKTRSTLLTLITVGYFLSLAPAGAYRPFSRPAQATSVISITISFTLGESMACNR